jgi:pimeloyl-ACP methyl ester carboxylesterase
VPSLTRPDGVELHWDEYGDGPPVVVPLLWTGHPRLAEPITQALRDDHRVVVTHPRGMGDSTRTGPYDGETDAGDLAAVVREAGIEAGVLIGMANTANWAIRVGTTEPDAVRAVLIANAAPLGTAMDYDPGEALAGSRSVLTTMVSMLETSFRAGMRSMITTGNPSFSDERVQQRIEEVLEFCEPEGAIGRLRTWIADDVSSEARALGDRLWWLTTTDNPWFPDNLADQVPELLPEAHVEPVEDGPINRPDITAALVRRITGAG